MQKLIETLKTFGIEIPADKQVDVKKALSEHYKNAAEHGKTISKLEAERDNWKEKAETAEETLKGFEGVDLKQIQTDLANWKKKAEDMEKDHAAEIYKRDFEDALKTALSEVKFTSEAAKKSVMADIRASELKLKDGKILGLSDLLGQLKEADASAFVDEKQQNAKNNQAKFTAPAGRITQPGGKYTMSELMRMKNENPDLDISQYMKQE